LLSKFILALRFFILLAWLPCFCEAQERSENDLISNRQLEKAFVLKNKIKKIAVLQYSDGKKDRFAFKNLYTYAANGTLLSLEIYSAAWVQEVIWRCTFVYDHKGRSDSVITQTTPPQKVLNPFSHYPSAYWHKGNKKLKNGLRIKLGKESGAEGTVLQYFLEGAE
jgi:hypothetical protein